MTREQAKVTESGGSLRPRLLDICCGAGGAARGYREAGFYVVGVDKDPQPRYVGNEFIQVDALEFLHGLTVWDFHRSFDAIHASFPCQAHSDLQKQSKRQYPDLIGPGRELLRATGLPYVIENVEGAPLVDPVTLCGAGLTSPGYGQARHLAFPHLRVIRHRLFEANFKLYGTFCPSRHPLVFTHDKRKAHYGKLNQDTAYVQVTGGGNCTVANKRDAMGIDWMIGAELNEAIPPAYTRFVGVQLIRRVYGLSLLDPLPRFPVAA